VLSTGMYAEGPKRFSAEGDGKCGMLDLARSDNGSVKEVFLRKDLLILLQSQGSKPCTPDAGKKNYRLPPS
jgi:hypothetical protein